MRTSALSTLTLDNYAPFKVHIIQYYKQYTCTWACDDHKPRYMFNAVGSIHVIYTEIVYYVRLWIDTSINIFLQMRSSQNANELRVFYVCKCVFGGAALNCLYVLLYSHLQLY